MKIKISEEDVCEFIKKYGPGILWKTKAKNIRFHVSLEGNSIIINNAKKKKVLTVSRSELNIFINAWHKLGPDARAIDYKKFKNGKSYGVSYVPIILDKFSRHQKNTQDKQKPSKGDFQTELLSKNENPKRKSSYANRIVRETEIIEAIQTELPSGNENPERKSSYASRIVRETEIIEAIQTELPSGNENPERKSSYANRIVRDTEIIRTIKQLHQNKCQLCGNTVQLANGETYSEAHHIKPLGSKHNGPDIPGNLIVLCPNHHVQCDRGAIRLDYDDLITYVEHVVEMEFLSYHNQIILKK